jgi:hypothetical protein
MAAQRLDHKQPCPKRAAFFSFKRSKDLLRVVDLQGAVMRPFSLPFRRVRRRNQFVAGRIDQRRSAQPLRDRGVDGSEAKQLIRPFTTVARPCRNDWLSVRKEALVSSSGAARKRE